VTDQRRKSGQHASQRRLTNCLWPAAVNHASPSASHHRSRSIVGSGGGWHGWWRLIKHGRRRPFLHLCRPFFRTLGVRCVGFVFGGRKKIRLLREIAIFFLAKNLRVKSLIKSILQNSVNFAPLISVIIIYFMTLKWHQLVAREQNFKMVCHLLAIDHFWGRCEGFTKWSHICDHARTTVNAPTTNIFNDMFHLTNTLSCCTASWLHQYHIHASWPLSCSQT